MESILWMLDLIAVAALCLWALQMDKRDDKRNRKGKN